MKDMCLYSLLLMIYDKVHSAYILFYSAAPVVIDDDLEIEDDGTPTSKGRKKGGSAKKTVAPLKIKINKKKRKKKGSSVSWWLCTLRSLPCLRRTLWEDTT